MKSIVKNWSAVAVAALGVGAFASATQAGSVVNLIQGGIPPVINVIEDGSRQGFFQADGTTAITGHVPIVAGDVLRGYFQVDKVNGVAPSTQGVEWTAIVGLKIVSISAGGFVTFGADTTFATQYGLAANSAVAFYEDPAQNANPLNINTYNDGNFFWSMGFVNANNQAVSQAFQQVFGDAGSATSAATEIALSNFSFDITGFAGIASAIVSGLQTTTGTGSIVNNGGPGTLTGQFIGNSGLFGSQGAASGTVTPNYAIIDNAHISFAVFAPAPEAFWGGAALLGSVGAVRLLRRRTVAC